MNTFVLNAVVKDCWNATGKYHTVSVVPARVSKAGGIPYETRVAGRFTSPPKTEIDNPFFHYYHIGEIEPYLFGVYKFIRNEWVSLEQLMRDNDVVISAVLDNGIVLSPKDCWLKKAGVECNYILAVYDNPMFNYGYRNTYFRQESIEDLVLSEDQRRLSFMSYECRSRLLQELEKGYVLSEQLKSISFPAEECMLRLRMEESGELIISEENHNLAFDDMECDREWCDVYIDQPRYSNTISDSRLMLNFYVNPAYFKREKRPASGKNVEYVAANPATQSQVDTFLNQFDDKKVGWVLFNGLVSNLGYAKKHSDELVQKEVAVYTDETIINTFWSPIMDLPITSIGGRSAISIRLGETGFYDVDNTSVFIGTGDGTEFLGVALDVDLRKYLFQLSNLEIGIDCDIVARLRSLHPELAIANFMFVYVVVRENVVKNFGLNAARLDLLDSLSFKERDLILSGEIPWLNNWDPKNLKDHPFLQLMSTKPEDFTNELILNGYGYSGINRLLNPYPVYPTKRYDNEKLTHLFRAGRALREVAHREDLLLEIMVYDNEGLLTRTETFPTNTAGYLIFDNIVNSKFAEVNLVKQPSREIRFNTKIADNFTLTEDAKFFGYGCFVAGRGLNNWSRAIEGRHYHLIGDRIRWEQNYLEEKGLEGCTVVGGFAVNAVFNLDRFKTGNAYAIIPIARDADGRIGIAPANLELYVNGELLIRGIDYVIYDGLIYILKPTSANSRLQVRFSGISPTGQLVEPIDSGFTDNGHIGFDGKSREFNYKQCKFNIGGRVFDRDEIQTADQRVDQDLVDHDSIEEITIVPYEVTQRIASIEHFLERSTIEAVSKEDVNDKLLYNVLNELYPISAPRRFTEIKLGERYKVVSFTFNQILNRLRAGWLKNEIRGTYTDMDVLGWCYEYQAISAVEAYALPLYEARFVEVIPHDQAKQTITSSEYMFLTYVNRLILKNYVQIDRYFELGG